MAKNSKQVQQKADEKRKGQRSRNWTLILYPTDLPEGWRETINGLHIKWIESPYHDRDINADGSPKKEHIHILLMFENVKSKEQVAGIFKDTFGESETGSIVGVATPQMVSDRTALVRYFAHMDNPSKAQYLPSDIVGHCGADVDAILKSTISDLQEMIVEIEEYIDDNSIYELCDLSRRIRCTHPEWHILLSTKMTMYFDSYIRSRRHSMKRFEEENFSEPCGFVDPDTGEVL